MPRATRLANPTASPWNSNDAAQSFNERFLAVASLHDDGSGQRPADLPASGLWADTSEDDKTIKVYQYDGIRDVLVWESDRETGTTRIDDIETTARTNKVNIAALQAHANSVRTGSIPGKLLAQYLTAGTYTWTAPDDNGDGSSYIIEYELKGAGGGGAKAAGSYGGTGGAEGETVIGRKAVVPGTQYTGVVGAGGKGGTTGTTYNSDQDTTNGAVSTFSGVTATGGGRGNTAYLAMGAGGGTNSFGSSLIRIKGENGHAAQPHGGTSYCVGSKGAGKHGGRSGYSGNSAAINTGEAGLLGCGGGASSLTSFPGGKGGDGYLLIWRVQ